MAVIPQVMWFAQRMQEQLNQNSHKGGWKDCSQRWLLARARQELDEVLIAIVEHPDEPEKVIREIGDGGNFLMMLADSVRKNGVEKPFVSYGQELKARARQTGEGETIGANDAD